MPKRNACTLLEMWCAACQFVVYSGHENEWWLQKVLREKLQEEYDDSARIVREVPLKLMWSEEEIEQYKLQSFPQFSEGTDILIFFNNSDSFSCFNDFNVFNKRINNADHNANLEPLEESDKTKLQATLLNNSEFGEVKFFEGEKTLDKAEYTQRTVIDSCYFCSGIETSSSFHPKDEQEIDQFITTSGNPSYRKEGQLIWDYFRALRTLNKTNNNNNFYIFLVVKIPINRCGSCSMVEGFKPDHDIDKVKCRTLDLLKKYPEIEKDKDSHKIILTHDEKELQKQLTLDVIEGNVLSLSTWKYYALVITLNNI